MSSATRKPGIHLDTISTTFEYDSRFPSGPTNETNFAWANLFPDELFFRNPTVAPEISTFTAYHQLHCVDSLRQGYWIFHDAAMERRELKSVPGMALPPHILHCIELLRQGVMCTADSSVEINVPHTKNVESFGVVHECRSWEQLKDWTLKWAVEV